MVNYKFRVFSALGDNERMCVVGDCPELGNWDPSACFFLAPAEDRSGVHEGELEIEREEILFRYFHMSTVPEYPGLAVPRPPENGELKWRIQRYECHDKPRRREAKSVTPLDEFGNADGVFRLGHGWITEESVVQLKLFNDAVKIWNESFVGKKTRIVVSSFIHKGNAKYSSAGPDPLKAYRSGSPLWYSDLNEDSTKTFTAQPEAGVPIDSNENLCLTFQTAVADRLSKMGFMVEVFFEALEPQNEENGDGPPGEESRAFSLLLPSHLSKSLGMLTVPLSTLKHELVGEIRVEHLVINPTVRSSHQWLHRLYSKEWQKSWVGLEIGHRGLGQSFASNSQSRAEIRENTFHSFMEAGRNGADMIELDVHLTADKIPVIYHDFKAPVKLMSKKSRDTNMNTYDLSGQPSSFMLAIRDRTFSELQDILINNESDFEKKLRESGGLEDMEPLSSPFPSLKSVLESLDPSIGINVELKYPNHLTEDSKEFDRPFDLNEYVDTIITTLEESPIERLIVLSCFNPDVCHALKLKQTAFPVLFLTQGITAKWPPYTDPRTKSTEFAIRFAKATGLLGISCHAEELLKDMSLITHCINQDLVMFIWGEDTNDKTIIRRFKDLGVHGIIIDRLDALTEKVDKISVLKRGSASL